MRAVFRTRSAWGQTNRNSIWTEAHMRYFHDLPRKVREIPMREIPTE